MGGGWLWGNHLWVRWEGAGGSIWHLDGARVFKGPGSKAKKGRAVVVRIGKDKKHTCFAWCVVRFCGFFLCFYFGQRCLFLYYFCLFSFFFIFFHTPSLISLGFLNIILQNTSVLSFLRVLPFRTLLG
ncbi:hypothetical protein BD289DRAFT_240177 [Coniella lustricola]|uniref:Transmembrane protein n=1 Tax=Coniella lustricola TaxID=2025994 RepID=A0A2T3ALD2_9PEZI|nr:hypothetical protein BD289DRAFT_240177 [Coniella lustricola]